MALPAVIATVVSEIQSDGEGIFLAVLPAISIVITMFVFIYLLKRFGNKV